MAPIVDKNGSSSIKLLIFRNLQRIMNFSPQKRRIYGNYVFQGQIIGKSVDNGHEFLDPSCSVAFFDPKTDHLVKK